MKHIFKITMIGFVTMFASCSTMKQNISNNQKRTSEQIETLFLINGNAFCISSSFSTLSTVWSYSNGNIFIYRLSKGKIVKEETYLSQNPIELKYDFKEELIKSGCIELDGDGFSVRLKKNSEIESQDLPINIKCFTQKKYKSDFLNKIVEDINTYKMWYIEQE